MHSLSLLFLTTATSAYLTPNPSPPGKYNVSLATGPLTDYTRTETVDGKPTPRTLMLSVFQPAECASTVSAPYMPPKTAKYQGPYLEKIFNITYNFSPLFENAELPVCPQSSTISCPSGEEWPILLFQPGYSIPRLYYSVLASSIASEGFVVIAIDSPGDANIITYPDGSAVYNTNPAQTIPVFRHHLPSRIADAKFVLDQLSNATAISQLLPQRGHHAFSTDKVAMFGHSEGGVAAVLTAAQDKRLKGAANWDGTFVSKPSEVEQPTLLISHQDADATWIATWPRLQGPKLWVNVANTTHESFSDAPALLQAAGEGKDLAAFGSLLGTLAPAEMRKILATYTSTWMRDVFAGEVEGAAVQAKKAKEFPAIQIVKEGNL